MTKPTGRPPGRPKGSKNKRTEKSVRAVAKIAARIEQAVDGAFTGDAHAFLMSVYKNPAHAIDLRLDAAKAAVRYEKPALATIEVNAESSVTINDISAVPIRTVEEWAEQHVTPH